jgi:hypothetical protein
MEKQESKTQLEIIQEKIEKYFNISASVIWCFIEVFMVFCVIALLYVNDFIGASNLLYIGLLFFVCEVVLFTVIWSYIALINLIIKKNKPRQELRRLKFKEEIKKELLKEMKNGRTKK